jgi:polyketide biosynthesis enoyl-CoA hydratase PksI
VTPTPDVVELTEPEPGIALVTMADRAHRNAFSPALVAGLRAAFTAARTAGHRVVVLTGYGSYFSTGGTREGLLAIQDGSSRFTDVDLYALALECELPVVCAMQGHAIGGGLALGLFGDFAVLSRESVYTANFMDFGFTPGMGATLVLPAKLGAVLGTELLATARRYRGAELAARGVPYPVVPRGRVLPEAMELARSLADKPPAAMRALKAHLARPLREALPAAIERELALHEATVHADDVRRRVLDHFGEARRVGR